MVAELPLQGVWLHCLAHLHLSNWRRPDNKQPSMLSQKGRTVAKQRGKTGGQMEGKRLILWEISVPQKVVKRKPTNLILSAKTRLSVWGLSFECFSFHYFFSQLIIDSLEILFPVLYFSLYFLYWGVWLFFREKEDIWWPDFALFLEGTFDWSLISQASPQWMDPRVDLTQVLSISWSALLSQIRGLHVWGKNVHRARCTY